MRVFGTGTVGAPVDAVWAALSDPDVLLRAIPGCVRLDVTGPGQCELTVATSIAAVAGTYSGDAEIRDPHRPGPLFGRVSVAGGRGSVVADLTVRLTSAGEGATEVGYEADAQIGGAIAGVGQLVLASIAARLAREFIGSLGVAAGLAQLAVQPQANGRRPIPEARRADGGQQAAGTRTREESQPPDEVIAQARRGIGLRGESAADLDRPPAGSSPAPAWRAASWPAWSGSGPGQGARAGVLAGVAVGLAGILIGALLGRRGRRARVGPERDRLRQGRRR